MDNYDVINDNEIRIVGKNPNNPIHEEPQQPKRPLWKRGVVAIIILALIACCVFLYRACADEKTEEKNVTTDTTTVTALPYVEISDTVINNISLRRFIPMNAKPSVKVGLFKQIPQEYVLGAMAADFGKYGDEYQVVGSFVQQGNMLSHSKSKYGFCAILKDTVVIGNDLATPYFEQAIEEKGDFFRQYALVEKGEAIDNPPTHKDALRRALCRMNDGRLCIIDTDMEVSLNDFAKALCSYGIRDAITLMGTGAAVRWAVDKAGRRYIAGADEYEFPDVVNYIVWE